MKFAVAPGASVAKVNTGVFPVRLLITKMLFRIVFPVFRTVPV